MKGNFHVRFLGGKGVVIPLTYPIGLADIADISLTGKAAVC